MNREQILDTIRALAQSQGSYGRLLEALKSNDDAMEYLEAQQFGGPVDMIMFLEG